MHRWLALLLIALLPACATVTSGTSQDIALSTDPPGARCEVTRAGAVIGSIASTPGTLSVSKSSQAVSINCTRPGSLTAVQSVEAELQATTLGNILIGGVIGVAVDAATGAMSRYPANIIVTLPPDRFATLTARDSYFDGKIADARRSFAERITTARGYCGTTDQPCPAATQLETQRETEIARLETQRTSVRIDS